MSTPLNQSEPNTSTSSDNPTDGKPSLPPSPLPPPTNLDSSPLLRLPCELREMIYTHALGGHTFLMSMRYINQDEAIARADNPPPHALALLLTNRQIYAEARLLLFPNSTFSGRHDGHLREWLRSLPPSQRDQVKAVKFVRRGYIVETECGMDVSPSFWIGVPSVAQWELGGLKRIEVEVTLLHWGWLVGEQRAEETKEWVMERLRRAIEGANPGVRVVVWRSV